MHAFRTSCAVASLTVLFGACGETLPTTDPPDGSIAFDGMADGGSPDGDTMDAKPTDAAADVLMPGRPCMGDADCERIVFVTSAQFVGNDLGGLAGADAKCAELADRNPALRGRNWRAWLSDESDGGAAEARLVHGTRPYLRLDGAEIAASWTGLVDSILGASISIDELGREIGPEPDAGHYVWTGTSPSGRAEPANCGGWQRADAGPGGVGLLTEDDTRWTKHQNRPCDRILRLYCFEQ